MEDWQQFVREVRTLIDNEEFEKVVRSLTRAEKDFAGEAGFHLLKGDALWANFDLCEGLAAYERALELAPGSFECRTAVALALFELLQFGRAREIASKALADADPSDPGRADLLDMLSRLAERDGDYGESDRLAQEAADVDAETYPVPLRMTEAEFQLVADQAVEDLPAEFLRALRKNLAMVIEPVPSREVLEIDDPPLSPSLLGLYTGVPLPLRESSNAPPPLPDVIHLFQRNIERESSHRHEVAEQITTTVYHEIGHYLGMEEADLEDLDLG